VASDVTIRPATAADAEMLAEFGARTFEQAFGPDNTPADMAAHIASTFTSEIMATELANESNLFLVAEIDAVAAGYAKLRSNDPHTGVSGERPAQLSRIYVDRAWLGRGIGPALMQRCLDEARAGGADVIWLGVWERNERAIAFYEKWGFTKVGEHEFVVGSDPQTDWVMARPV